MYEEQDQQEEQMYRKPYEDESTPATSDTLLGQLLLQTYARVSDPDMVEFRKIRSRFPKIGTKTVIDEDGTEKEVNYITEWVMEEYEIPIRVQPKYHEIITDDIARAFLEKNEFYLYLDNGSYCQSVRSFAKRYEVDLSLHHNHIVDDISLMVVGSGSIEGQRPTLAKTNIAKTISKQDSFSMMEQRMGAAKKKKFLGLI